MDERAEMAERHGRMLGRLAEMSLALAERLHDKAMAAEAEGEIQSLSSAYHRMARSARQSMALEERFWRERARWAREEETRGERRDTKQLARRKGQVKARVERLIWDEHEGDEAEALVEELERRLDEDALFDGFLEAPLEAHVTRLCAELALSGSSPSAQRDLGEVANPPPLGVACEARGAGSQQRPGGQPEGVRSDLEASAPASVDDVLPNGSGGPPQSASPTAPPTGKHLRADHPWRSSG
jgi:hypothetical protein